jgi:anti-anti-sigma factor
MSFELKVERAGDVVVLEIVGEFLLGPKLRRASVPLREATDAAAYVVDLSGCSKVDSAGLGELIMWYAIATRAHKKLLLAGVRENFAQMMRVARVDSVLLIARDRAAALAELGLGSEFRP